MNQFDELWLNWPREGQAVGPKKKAKEMYAKKVKTEELHNLVMISIFGMKVWRAHLHSTNSFVPQLPHVFRWIRDERWEDEIPEMVVKEKQSIMDRLSDTSWADTTDNLEITHDG